jgi:hypothetical protein
MAEKVNLTKNVFNKQQFTKTVNTQFSEPATTPSQQQPLPTVGEFFNYYQELFYDIPKLGVNNSHEYLIRTSQEYVGDPQLNSEIEALLQEINSLRQTVLDQQQTIQQLSTNFNTNG